MTETRKIPLFDLGNVLVRIDFSPFFDWLKSRSAEQNGERLRGLLSSSLFYDFEFGNVGRKEFFERCSQLYGVKAEEAEFFRNFNAIFAGPIPEMPELLEELLAEGPVYCLSNTNEAHAEAFMREFPFLGNMTKLFLSHEMRKRKPYPGIYRDIARELDIDPRSLCFFDDLEANVLGARKAGLEAHIFSGAASVRRLLRGNNFSDLDDKENRGNK